MTSRGAGERVAPASGRIAIFAPLLSVATALTVAATALFAVAASAQSPETYASSCVLGGGTTSRCLSGGVTGRSMLGAIGLAAAGGNSVPSTATTLGSRVGGGPRISPFVAVGRSGGALPGGSSGSRDFGITTLRAGVAVGVFDGLRLMPTVGGFLSLDLIATGSVARLPAAHGFSGSVTTLGAGVRVGVLREGFSVPGIAVSIARRYSGASRQDSNPETGSVTADPAATSIRATVGKDAGGVEVVGGFGWDGYSGDVTIPDVLGPGSYTGPVDGSRRLYFVGGSMTFSIVLAVSVEAGWAGGFDPVTGYAGPFDPTTGSAFGSFTARLIL